jgi:threonine/homoserine/homoserine lactone efflux protein
LKSPRKKDIISDNHGQVLFYINLYEEYKMLSVEFLITSLVVVLIPGTGVIYTVSNGLFAGRRAAVAAACGCTAGIIPHLLACITGLALILHTSAVAFSAVKFIGAVYLMYMAWSMWRETGVLKFDDSRKSQNSRQIAVRGMLINILNPKLSIFFLAYLPLFVSPDAGAPTLQMLFMSGIFMAITLVIFILYGIFANAVRTYVVSSKRIMTTVQRSFAVIFALLGLKLALSDK